LLGVGHILEIDLHVVLLFKIANRGFDASGFFNVLPDVELPGGMRLQAGELPRRQGGKDQCSKRVLFHYQPHVKV